MSVHLDSTGLKGELGHLLSTGQGSHIIITTARREADMLNGNRESGRF